MGVYSEYLDNLHDIESVTRERKKQLGRIASIRGRSVLAMASDIAKAGAPTGIDSTDLLHVADQLDTLSGTALDVVIETPGGYAERAEDIVLTIRDRFETVGFIVPGVAMSAGTIMVMSGDEILLEPRSSLGPIDAQVMLTAGRRFSAHAFLEGLEKIKGEVENAGNLNRAYVPILQGINVADIQACENAQDFSRKLVSNWLATWKFRSWETHSSTGEPVTQDEKLARAEEIATHLCNHSQWLTHSKSIRLTDLVAMGLRTTDYSKIPELYDAIRRYHILLRMTFDGTSIYKLYETPDTQIYRHGVPVGPIPPPAPAPPGRPVGADVAHVELNCPRCGNSAHIQANLGKPQPLQQGSIPFPRDNELKCPNCALELNLVNLRKRLEAQNKKPIVT